MDLHGVSRLITCQRQVMIDDDETMINLPNNYFMSVS